ILDRVLASVESDQRRTASDPMLTGRLDPLAAAIAAAEPDLMPVNRLPAAIAPGGVVSRARIEAVRADVGVGRERAEIAAVLDRHFELDGRLLASREVL